MDFIYLLTGLCTVALAIAGLVLACYLENRWVASEKSGSAEPADPGVAAEGRSQSTKTSPSG